ncbi:hypothetical protein PHET_01962 [Paragonimus heterotremus]|uniref:Uncharacterized protein n=1 Tax=Paragonimus heterotremus TaxID=100268 RepID=A0A8J4T4C7_9TREM|nr:hypothetical protein PHET_01962 [Paragonimus heterotremus]
MYYPQQFMPSPTCGCPSVTGPPIPIAVMPCACYGVPKPSSPCACNAPKPSLPSKVTESPHTSMDSLISPVFKILEEQTFTANHSALLPLRPISVEVSPLLLKQKSPPPSPSENLPPPADQRKKVDSIREYSELTTISESLGKNETIQKSTKMLCTIVHYEDLTPDASYAPRETKTRKRTMSTVVHYESSDPDISYSPDAVVSHNRTVSTVVHYEGTNPDATYAPQLTDSMEQVSEVIVPYELSPPEMIISPYLVNQYTTQDVESITNLQLDTSETNMFSAVFKPDCPFGCSVEFKISTVCNCVLDDHMSQQGTTSYEAQQEPTTKANADTNTLHVSPAEIMKTIQLSSTTAAVEKDGNLFKSDAKHGQFNPIMRALSSKQPVSLSGEQVHYEMPTAIQTMQNSPMYPTEHHQCLNRSTGPACSPHGICTPVGPSTYIHVTTRTKCCQNHSCVRKDCLFAKGCQYS